MSLCVYEATGLQTMIHPRMTVTTDSYSHSYS